MVFSKIFVLSIASLFLLSCSHFQFQNNRTNVDSQGVPSKDKNPTSHYTVISFSEGSAELSLTSLGRLKELAETVKKTGKTVREIQVLAWADRDEPGEQAGEKSEDAKIALERAERVKKVLNQELKTPQGVQIVNMARSPSSFSEILNKEKTAPQTTFEFTGTTSLDNGPKSSLAMNKASSALVLVRYQ